MACKYNPSLDRQPSTRYTTCMDPNDIRTDIYRSGLHTPVAVRVTHIPTGLSGWAEAKTEAEAKDTALIKLQISWRQFMTAKSISPQETLRRAAAVIEERGFHRGYYSDPVTGAVCVLGAINVVQGRHTDALTFGGEHSAERAIEKYLRDHGQLGEAEGIACWNDRATTTPVEVVGTLRLIADQLDARTEAYNELDANEDLSDGDKLDESNESL